MEQKKLKISTLFEGLKVFIKDQFKRLDTWVMISCCSYVGAMALMFLVGVLITINGFYFTFPPVALDPYEHPLVFGASIFFALLTLFVSYKILKKAIGISNALILNALAAAENKTLPIFSIRDERLSFVLYALLYLLLFLLGNLFFIIPGIIFFVRSSFAYMIMLEEKCSPIQALQRSWSMTQGYFWQLFVFIFPIWIIGLVIPLIGFIFMFVPLNVWIFVYLYNQIKEQRYA